MTLPQTSKARANRLWLATLLIGLAAISYADSWWPFILLAIGAANTIRQYLRGRPYDIPVTIIIFGGLFIYDYFPLQWDFNILPIIFTIGALTIFYREFFTYKKRSTKDEEEDILLEIEDEIDND